MTGTADSTHNPNVQRLEQFFRNHPIARLDELERLLGASGRTVFRTLRRMGYLSSYSHAGRYYTLARIPAFDANGIWQHSGVLFSRYGTLRKTAAHLVSTAPAGHTHPELQDRLRLRVYDTLADLVAAGEINRAKVAQLYLYVSAETKAAEAQITARKQLIEQPPMPGPLPDAAIVIEVLLEVIHSREPDIASTAAHLRAQGKMIAPEQVAAVWAHYGLGKKNRTSRRSRR
jgi:hypothetical protein